MELLHNLPTQKRVDAYVAEAKHLRNQTLIKLAKRYLQLPGHRATAGSAR